LFKRFHERAREDSDRRPGADVPDDWIVVGVVKRPIWRDGKVEGFIRRIIMDRANKDLPHQPEPASEQNEISEGIVSERHKTD
jgi:hypothetical protein